MDNEVHEIDRFHSELAEALDTDEFSLEINYETFRVNLAGSDDLYEIIAFETPGQPSYAVVRIGKGNAFED